MKMKKTALFLTVLMILSLILCSCSTTKADYSGGEVCGYTPYMKPFRSKKPVVHPAPETPIGGDFMRY